MVKQITYNTKIGDITIFLIFWETKQIAVIGKKKNKDKKHQLEKWVKAQGNSRIKFNFSQP